MQELLLKKCSKCQTIIKVLVNNCPNIKCCDELMTEIIPNSIECAQEKHLPQYKKKANKIIVTVNHVMEKEHYIEWVLIKYKNGALEKYFQPNDSINIEAPYEKGAIIYSYCNKHGLWQTIVE